MATEDRLPVEDIVAAFLLEREDGKNPNVDDWLARYPKDAEVLAKLLSDDTASPATFRRPTGRGTAGSKPPTPRAAAASDAIRLGPYEVLEHVSTAGGGTVYRARHREGGHVVALKVLDSRGAIDPRDVERFHREAGMLRALNLVHVVPVLDSGEEGGRFWIAMKWLEGDTFSKLREAVAGESHRLHDFRERARLVARVARTFGAIHAYGILHRDVKPTNIMVDTTGEPMIIDFGIAHAPDLPELTATTDQVMGTPRFLAPELLAGGNREVSPRTDVYGLGLCLYEICTGAEVFKQGTRADLFTAIRTTGPLAPRKANPRLSHDLAAVILRAIEIAPARRYPDMGAFADDLERVARGEAPDPVTLRGAHPALRFVRRHRARLIAAAVLAAVLIPAGWLLTRRALDQAAARNDEGVLRPFAWFAPEAFAGGIGLPAPSTARALASNPAATPLQRLLAAWIPFISGDCKGASENLGAEDADDEFATRVLRGYLRGLKEAAQGGDKPSAFYDPVTKQLAINPRTGQPYEVMIPQDAPKGAFVLGSAEFDQLVEAECRKAPPRSSVDHLVLATLSWAVMPQNPDADCSARKNAISQSIERAISVEPTRIPASHLRGVIRLLACDFAGARDDFQSVVATQPEAVGTRYLLGIALARSGAHQQAVECLDGVLRKLPRDHRARRRVIGHLALAYGATGRIDQALDTCQRWSADYDASGEWADVIMPKMVAAGIVRDHGELGRARDLFVEVVRAEEGFRKRKKEDAEKHLTPVERDESPLLLWEPPFLELIAVAETLGDDELAESFRAHLGSFRPQRHPKSAAAYLDLNLAGLRIADVERPVVNVQIDPGRVRSQ